MELLYGFTEVKLHDKYLVGSTQLHTEVIQSNYIISSSRMSFHYHPLDDDTIEHIGSVQEPPVPRDPVDDTTLCPQRPLLPRWPLCVGVCELIVGFIAAVLGAVHIFVVPFLLNIESGWYLSPGNSYGAALWSGFMLVVAGSLAVRVSKYRTLKNVQLFYVGTVSACLVNVAMLVLILWSYMTVASSPKYDYTSMGGRYSAVPLTSYVLCVLGSLLLFATLCRYFMASMFGEVQLTRTFLICCCPCIVPYCKLAPSAASSHQSVDNVEPNMIV